jgi:hypothetical protein
LVSRCFIYPSTTSCYVNIIVCRRISPKFPVIPLKRNESKTKQGKSGKIKFIFCSNCGKELWQLLPSLWTRY